MDAIVDKWKAFSIMDKKEVLDVEDGSLAKSNSRLLFKLVGRVITKKPAHKGVFQKVIKQLRKVDQGFETRCLDRDTFMFSFKLEREQKRVLLREPWHFSKAMIILKRLEDCSGLTGEAFNMSVYGARRFGLDPMLRLLGWIFSTRNYRNSASVVDVLDMVSHNACQTHPGRWQKRRISPMLAS
ncbi:hypothetical protein PanWU01x14_200930 [Parasponia andersonii]|uniref:DUF4283 domain-containing protein n=1 Tax=Parasponia andersonii TaxID=3476 RepID=A0A2P5BY04_PARAD|nr:hypothetical protein PanWU01x14_200930 [Parasponia andersonii]